MHIFENYPSCLFAANPDPNPKFHYVCYNCSRDSKGPVVYCFSLLPIPHHFNALLPTLSTKTWHTNLPFLHPYQFLKILASANATQPFFFALNLVFPLLYQHLICQDTRSRTQKAVSFPPLPRIHFFILWARSHKLLSIILNQLSALVLAFSSSF